MPEPTGPHKVRELRVISPLLVPIPASLPGSVQRFPLLPDRKERG